MPILSDVGRRSPAQVAARVGIYGLLTLGAIGIIYPVLIVLGQTMSNAYDLRDNAIIPYYLRDRNELLLKHIYSFTPKVNLLAARHNRNKWSSQTAMREDTDYYEHLPAILRRRGLNLDAHEAVVADLNAFKASMNPDHLLAREFRIEDYYRPFLRERYGKLAEELLAAYEKTGRLPEWMVRTYPDPAERERILADRDRLGTAVMNNEWHADYLNYYSVEVLKPGNFVVPFWRPGAEPKQLMWRDFKASLPPEQTLILSSDAYWQTFLKLRYHGQVADLNAAWGSDHAGWAELRVPFQPPPPGTRRDDWEFFIVRRWPRRLLIVPRPDPYAAGWRKHVRKQLLEKHADRPDPPAAALEDAGAMLGGKLASWDDLPLPTRQPADETLGRYWGEYTSSGAVPAGAMALDAPERTFPRFLEAKYTPPGGDAGAALAALNAAWRTEFDSFDDVPLPLALADYAPVRFHPWRLRWSFMTESFERVTEYLLGRGRAVQNTLILVVCALASALTINPLAAYSLSRFPMKHTQKVLIFFLATMAFPAEVAMIPNFLLLRSLGMLNTFAALVLPGMANGFAIFLLKGFFDSLPQELYEAAEIDGASEVQIFRVVAMPLVKPILAFIGLNTFVLAYSSFMWAFVICPSQRMWTLMVWVYDFQMKNPGNNYILAATVLVSIPPLIVFFFANRIIMRGIVIPSMK